MGDVKGGWRTGGSSGRQRKESSSEEDGRGEERRGQVISNSLHTSPQRHNNPRHYSNNRLHNGSHNHTSASVGHTPSKQPRPHNSNDHQNAATPNSTNSARGDNLLRRAAIEHQRRQNRKLSSSSEDENDRNTSRRHQHSSRPGTPKISSRNASRKEKKSVDERKTGRGRNNEFDNSDTDG